MKKLYAMLLLLLPLTLAAQWSIAPSVGVGISNTRNFDNLVPEYTDLGYTGSFKAKQSLLIAITTKYSFAFAYAGTGVEYRQMKSVFDISSPAGYNEMKDRSYKLQTVGIPLYMGLYIPKIKLTPIVEAGYTLNLTTTVNRDSQKQRTKVWTSSYILSAGLRYKLQKNALELKLYYLNTGNVAEDDNDTGTNTDRRGRNMKWQDTGIKLSYHFTIG